MLIERGLPGLNRVEEFRPGNDEKIPGDGEDRRSDRAGDARAKGLGERSQ